MANLTVTEKQHWRDRIAARIGRSIEGIKARHPALFERVRREAHAQALRSLGLAEGYAELEAIRAEEAALDRREKQAQWAMVAALRGTPIDEVPDGITIRYGANLPLPVEAAEAIAKRQAAHQEELLADDPVGRQVAGLEAERERLLDVVWLAAGPSELRSLWSKVAALLGDEPTGLEREALAIPPSDAITPPGC